MDRGNFRLEKAGMIRRHEPVLPSPNDEGSLVQCPHDGLQGRDLLDPKSADRNKIPKRFENCLMRTRRAGEDVFCFDKLIRDE
jgi:hypothetical protein